MRAIKLRGSILIRLQLSNDIPACTKHGKTRISWPENMKMAELRICTIGCGKTSFSAEGISIELILPARILYKDLTLNYFEIVFDLVTIHPVLN